MTDDWYCWICGHFSSDYEEAAYPSAEVHALGVHSLTDDEMDELCAVKGQLHDEGIFVGSDQIAVDMMAHPSRGQWSAVALASGAGTMKPSTSLTFPATDADEDAMLADMYAGRRLSNLLEGLNYTFYLANISRVTTHQLVRTRIGAVFLQQSSRPIDVRDAFSRMPITVFGDAVMRERFREAVADQWNDYALAVDNSIPFQDARFYLPESFCTHIVATYNVPALQAVMAKRLRNFMQWEINSVMRAVRATLRAEEPEFSKRLVAGCELSHQCQQNEDYLEGCGKFPNPFPGPFKTPNTKSPHGYRFNMKRFRGESNGYPRTD